MNEERMFSFSFFVSSTTNFVKLYHLWNLLRNLLVAKTKVIQRYSCLVCKQYTYYSDIVYYTSLWNAHDLWRNTTFIYWYVNYLFIYDNSQQQILNTYINITVMIKWLVVNSAYRWTSVYIYTKLVISQIIYDPEFIYICVYGQLGNFLSQR